MTQSASNAKLRYFMYVRKSTDTEDKQVRSIDDQIAELNELASRENVEVVRTFIEKQSAKKPGRPLFGEMLEAIRLGEANGILAWHPDRLARNSIDSGQIIYYLDTNVIRQLRFASFWFDNTPQGKFMLQIAFGQSKYYVDSLSDNVRRAIRQKFNRGECLHKAPVGYINDKNARRAVIDPQKARWVREGYELYAQGAHSVRRVRDVLYERGLRSRSGGKMTEQNVYNMLRNPFYTGFLSMHKELNEGKHPPIVPRELFDRVQFTMQRRRRRTSQKQRHFALRGMMTCKECGCLITAEVQKGHRYYRCSKRKTRCTQRYVREENLVSQMREIVARYAAPEAWCEFAIRELENERRSSTTAKADWKHRQEVALSAIDEKIARLTIAYVSQALTLDEFCEGKNRLIAEKAGIREKLAASETTDMTWFEPALEFVKRCHRALQLSSDGEIDDLRVLLETIGSNFFLSERRMTLAAQQSWKTLTTEGFFELVNAPLAHGATGSTSEKPVCTKMRPGLDLVRTFFQEMHQ